MFVSAIQKDIGQKNADIKNTAQKNIGQKDTIAKLETAIYQLIFSPEFSHQSLMLTNKRQQQSASRISKQSIHSGFASLRKKSRRGNHC